MFSLVRFLGDNFYHICSKGDTKSINGITLAKWRGKYYEAKLITSSEDYNILQSFCNNLLNKYPIVEIQRFDQNLSEKELYQDLFQEKKMPQEQPDKISSNVSKRDLAIEETFNDTIEVDAEYNSDPDPFDTDEDSSYVPHTSESSDSSVEYSLNKIDLLSLTSPKGWKEPLLHVQTDLLIHGVPYLPLHMRNRPSEVSSNLESDRRVDVPSLNIESNMQLDVPAHHWNDDCSLSIATLSSQDDFSLCYICGDMVQNLGAHVNIHNVALETLQESPKKSVFKGVFKSAASNASFPLLST